MSGTFRLRVVSFLLRSSFFLRHATRIVLSFLGEEVLTKRGAALLRAERARQNLFMGIQIRSLVMLATGSTNLGRLAAAVASAITEEESRIAPESEQPPSFLQDELSPKHVETVLKELDVPVNKTKARRIALALTASAEFLMVALLLSLSMTLSPVAVAVAVILMIIVSVKIMLAVLGQVIQETRAGPLEQAAQPIRQLYKEVKRQKW